METFSGCGLFSWFPSGSREQHERSISYEQKKQQPLKIFILNPAGSLVPRCSPGAAPPPPGLSSPAPSSPSAAPSAPLSWPREGDSFIQLPKATLEYKSNKEAFQTSWLLLQRLVFWSVSLLSSRQQAVRTRDFSRKQTDISSFQLLIRYKKLPSQILKHMRPKPNLFWTFSRDSSFSPRSP